MANEKDEIARKKYEDNLKYLYFSRYLMLRYSVTAYLFTNIFWLIFSLPYKKIVGIITAAIMTIFVAIAAIEQLSKMHNHDLDVPITRVYFWIQIIVNVLLIVLLEFPIGKYFFPFVSDQSSKVLILTILLVGIVLACCCEVRIKNIVKGKDRYAKVIATFKKNN
ncbi:PTS cellobiose transporter subunit IIA [Lactobacillus sp. ESL0731]|uniref:PTS cellobiose transporter subunit IIA n=1 Tax=unclassified Lactobacillus TaxID=2620435 RepID=UPI0023F9333C|nr:MULTISPECIES: PTS cellobiose transporter subunit IIA [unclassified Lactobacillus]WEV51551.1 PTS cellobiose transporter subunit IIA [Lactobacillus sp. ESL0700]WEV62679.1 PTS cellobiose transporter subunit IIA [Lactobacillus sp. ESL0731]